MEEMFYSEGGETLAQVSQRGGRCPIPGAPFQARLDGALSTLIQLKRSLLAAGGLDWVAFQGPFPPEPFCDSRMHL